ncbi:MAG: hypothetical protein JXR76_21030 [Deltaproteobacteria bacterium]|nr:hypothetical protein [Deltaproteobacteria bacterium]
MMRNSIIISYLLFVATIGGCQLVLPEMKDAKNGGTDTQSSSDNSSDTAASSDSITDSSSDSDTETDSDTGIPPQIAARNDCVAGGGFWYNETDVLTQDPVQIPQLAASCHTSATINCDQVTEVPVFLLENGAAHTEPQNATEIYYLPSEHTTAIPAATHILSPIRCLQNLSILQAYQNHIETADLSNNPYLTVLHLYNNLLTEAYLPRIPYLRALDLGFNALTQLDVSNAVALESIYVPANQLRALDLSGLAELTEVNVENNQLQGSLNLESATYLMDVGIADNVGLTRLILPGNPQYLENITAYNSGLTSLQCTECSGLVTVILDNAPIIDLQLSKASGNRLESVSAIGTDLTSLDLSGAGALQFLNVSDSRQLSALTLPATSSILELHVDNTHLSGLDLSSATSLRLLSAWDLLTKFTVLDIGNKPNLERLYASNHNLNADIDLSGSPKITDISLPNNHITGINLTGCTSLQNIELYSNNLTHIEIPAGAPVVYLDLSYNNLAYSLASENLDLSTLSTLTELAIQENPIALDSISFPPEFWANPAAILHVDYETWDAWANKPANWIFDGTDYYARME